MISDPASFNFTAWVLIPALIFVARLIDVTLATMRHILVFKGAKKIVPVLGFIEVLVWLIAMTQVINNLSNVACYLAWAGGFASGTWLGMVMEEKLALGHQLVRIVSASDSNELVQHLRAQNYGVTVLPAQGGNGPVELILIATTRAKVRDLIGSIRKINPTLFFTIEDVRSVDSGIFGQKRGD